MPGTQRRGGRIRTAALPAPNPDVGVALLRCYAAGLVLDI